MSTQIGWGLSTFELAVKQGSSGAFKLTSTVTKEDGSPLNTYDGWTASCKFDSPFSGDAVITFTPDVDGDAMAHTLATTISFVPSTTASLAPGVYRGDIFLTDPTDAARYCPANLNLTIQSSAA